MAVREDFLALLKDFFLILVLGIFFTCIFLIWIGSMSPMNALLFGVAIALGLLGIFGGLGLAIYILNHFASKK